MEIQSEGERERERGSIRQRQRERWQTEQHTNSLSTNTASLAHLLVVLGADNEITGQLQVLRVVWFQFAIDVHVGHTIICGPAGM